MENTPMYKQYLNGEFKMYNSEEMLDLVCKMKATIPKYCRLMRIMRQFDHRDIKTGKIKSNTRVELNQRMKELNLKCECIRCREVGLSKVYSDEKPELKVLEYDASEGKEFFISFETEDKLFGLCRARLPSKSFRKEITDKTLIIRELHVYGQQVPLEKESNKESQHKGLGKKLMLKAEEIAKKNDFKRKC